MRKKIGKKKRRGKGRVAQTLSIALPFGLPSAGLFWREVFPSSVGKRGEKENIFDFNFSGYFV